MEKTGEVWILLEIQTKRKLVWECVCIYACICVYIYLKNHWEASIWNTCVPWCGAPWTPQWLSSAHSWPSGFSYKPALALLVAHDEPIQLTNLAGNYYLFMLFPQFVWGVLLAYRRFRKPPSWQKARRQTTDHSGMREPHHLVGPYTAVNPHSSRCFIKVHKNLLFVTILQLCHQGPAQ